MFDLTKIIGEKYIQTAKLALAAVASIGVIAFAGSIYWKMHTLNNQVELLTTEKKGLQDANKHLLDVNQANLLQIKTWQDEATAALDALAAERDAAVERANKLSKLKGKVANVSESEDGPIAPVLRDVLDGLRSGAGEGTGADAHIHSGS